MLEAQHNPLKKKALDLNSSVKYFQANTFRKTSPLLESRIRGILHLHWQRSRKSWIFQASPGILPCIWVTTGEQRPTSWIYFQPRKSQTKTSSIINCQYLRSFPFSSTNSPNSKNIQQSHFKYVSNTLFTLKSWKPRRMPCTRHSSPNSLQRKY